MNEKIVFVRTSSGEDEVGSKTAHLSKDIKRALLMVDGTASVEQIMKRSSPSLRGMLEDMFRELVRGGFIRDKAGAARLSKLTVPQPAKPVEDVEELDFTAAYRIPTKSVLSGEAARLDAKSAAETKARELAEQEASRVQNEASQLAEEQARLVAEVERLKLQAESEARAREAAEIQARQEAQAAHARAEQAAREAAVRVEAERNAQAALEMARKAEQSAAKAEAQAQAVVQERAALQAELVKLKSQADVAARARVVIEEQAKSEAAAAKAERSEAAARARAEQEVALAAARAEAERHANAALEAAQHLEEVKAEAAARARALANERASLEAEVAKFKAQAEKEARAREEADARAKQEVEAARVKAEREAARVRGEVELARQRAEKEAQAREEAQRIAMQADAARVQAEQMAAQLKAEEEARIKAEEEARIKAEEEARIKAEEEARIKAEEEARIKAEQEARIKAEEEARIKAEQEARTKAEQEARIKAEEEARIKAEEEARIKAEQEARIKAEEEARIKAEEEARIKAEEEARIKAEQEARIKAEEEARIKVEEPLANAQEEAVPAVRDPSQWVVRGDGAAIGAPSNERRVTPAAVTGCDSRGGNNGVPVVERRTVTAAVLFFDIVGYTKQPDSKQLVWKQQFNELVTRSLASFNASERIILDTGDGAAIGFLQHPTDAMESAVHFRAALTANNHFDYPDLRVRTGINLGPVSLVKDMNGLTNMLGDGINSAQRVMGFAGQDQIYVSRAYYEFVSNLDSEQNDLFRYRGAKRDKHGREHQVYELQDAQLDTSVQMQESSNDLHGFNFDAFDAILQQKEESAMPASTERPLSDVADQLLKDALVLGQASEVAPVEEIVKSAVQESSVVVVEEDEPQYSEDEARALADAQAKKWLEAEQRSSELARAKVFSQPVFQQPLEQESAPVGKTLVKVRRKPLPWIRLGAGSGLLLLAALFVVPAVMPMQGYLAGIEQSIGSRLQQPVHIGDLAGRILPTPRLVLSEVSIGEGKQLQARQVQVNFAFSALFGQVKHIDSLNVDGAEAKGAALPQIASWLQQVADDRVYPVEHISLSRGALAADGIALSDVAGVLDFNSAGKFSKAHLDANAHKIALEINAERAVSITLRDSALPLFPNWTFDDMQAKGVLTSDELRITDMDGRIRGGVLTGAARINWRTGWRVQGSLEARVIPLQNINKLLSGDMDGSAHFLMQAASLEKLADAAILNGVFSVRKGLVDGVDIIETTRLHSRESLPGGRTHFDAMSGEFSYANDSYRFSPFKLSDSVVKANGVLTVNGQQLSGSMSADLSVRAGAGAATLQIGGTTQSPTLRALR